MKKITLLILLALCIVSDYSFAQDLTDVITSDIRTTGKPGCASINISFEDPYIRSDCPDIPQSGVKVSYRLSDCFGPIVGKFCGFSRFVIEYNGTPIKTIQYSDISSPTSLNIADIPGESYNHLIDGQADEACFTVRVYQRCSLFGESEIFSAEKCIPILKEGDLLEVVRYGGPVHVETLECLPIPEITVCCKDADVTITANILAEQSTSQSNTINILFGGFSINGSGFELQSPLTYTAQTNLTTTNSAGLSVTKSLTIKKEEGVCKSAAIVINSWSKYRDLYKAGKCSEDKHPYITHETNERQIYSMSLAECIFSQCVEKAPEMVFSKILDSSKNSNSCTGSIIAEIPDTYEGELDFKWIGPNGFSSDSQNLEDVPFGNYTLTVIDDCCNEYEYDYYLCDNIEYGSWKQQEQSLTFCRSLQCGAPNCEIADSEECVEPDEIIEDFENGSCIENYYYKGELLGQTFSSAEIKIEYNETNNQCSKVAFCNNEKFVIETGSPNYGNWNFDNAAEECYRSIICYNQQILNVKDTKDPDIIETYNLATGLCDRTAYCSPNQPITLNSKFPDASLPWQWSEFQGCIKNVTCSSDSGSENIYGNEAFINWEFNSSTNMCESDVTCQGELVFGVYNSEFPNSIGTWSWSSSRPLSEQCYRTIMCGNNVIEDTTEPTYETTTTSCGDNLFQYYIICDGTNTGEIGCGSLQSDDDDNQTRSFEFDNKKEEITVFPTPFYDAVNISGLDATNKYVGQLFSTSGQLVLERSIQNGQLKLEDILSGFYILKIKSNNAVIAVKKVYKQ